MTSGSPAHAGSASGDHAALRPTSDTGRIVVQPRTLTEIRDDRSDRVSWPRR